MKYLKATLFTLICVGLLVVAVLGWDWEDRAEKKFWYTIWPYVAVASAIGFVLLIRWFGKTKNKW